MGLRAFKGGLGADLKDLSLNLNLNLIAFKSKLQPISFKP